MRRGGYHSFTPTQISLHNRETRTATFEAGEEFLEVCAVLLYVQIYYCREGQ